MVWKVYNQERERGGGGAVVGEGKAQLSGQPLWCDWMIYDQERERERDLGLDLGFTSASDSLKRPAMHPTTLSRKGKDIGWSLTTFDLHLVD